MAISRVVRVIRHFRQNHDVLLKSCRLELINDCSLCFCGTTFLFTVWRTMATWREEAFSNIKSQNDAFLNQTEANSNARNNLKTQMTNADDSLVSNFGWLKSHASSFKLHGNKVEIIQEPCEFHRKLKVICGYAYFNEKQLAFNHSIISFECYLNCSNVTVCQLIYIICRL